MSTQAGKAARRKTAVRPSALAQFYDQPPTVSSRTNPSRQAQSTSAASAGFGAANRTSLNDQRMLKQVDKHDGLGGAFGRADYKNDVCLPRTEAQRILHREVDDRAEDEIYVVVPEHFTIAGVVAPTNKKLKIPKVDNEYLMTPQQRRELSAFELKQKEAVKLERTARGDKSRMLQIMRSAYPEGVIGLEAVEPKYGTPHPNIYAEKVVAAETKYNKSVEAQEARKAHLVANSDSLQRRGYSFINQDANAPRQGAIASRKARGLPQTGDTHSRLFARETYTHSPRRASALQQHDTRGRNYDLITGTAK